MGEKTKSPRIRRFGILGLTMIIVVIPFCLYYLFFVASQTNYYSKRSFRVLADIGDHVSGKIDNLANNLVNVAEKAKQNVEIRQTVESKRQPKPMAVAEKVEKAVTLVPDFKLDPNQYQQTGWPTNQRAVKASRPPLPRTPISNTAGTNRNTNSAGTNSNAAPRAVPAARRRPSTAAAPGATKGADMPVTLSVKPERGSFWLYLEYRASANGLPANIPVKSDLNELFEPFVSRYVIDELNETKERLFDEVLVAEQETGRVIFERGPSGLNVVALDNLLSDKGAKLELKLSDQSSSAVNVQLAGMDYKLFLQPVRLTVFARDDKDQKGVRWVVCGLTRADHFRDETFAVSYTVLIGFVFVVALAALSWPLLKLKLMGPKDRLRRADLGLTVVSALLGTATLTFVLLDLHSYINLEDTLDTQLEAFSARIKTNVHEELGRALAQLSEMNSAISALPAKDQTEATMELERSRHAPWSGSESGGSRAPSYSARRDLLAGVLDLKKAPYPYFNNVTWTDPDGRQRIKWTTRGDTTTFVKVAGRQFFQDARDSKTWTLTYEGKPYDFSFELINSRNTGENLAIIATRVPGSTWVSNLDTRLLSLMGTVVPVGFGYAVIESNGRVLFHSDEVKNLEEQFFAECENDRLLRAAVLSRTDQFINAKYLGKGHRLYVSPLAGTPWMLVVFRDKQIARTINLELLTLAMALYLGFALIMLGLISAIYLPRRGERISWLWPDPARARRYELLIAANLLIGLLFVAALTIKSGWFLIACCATIPVIATIFGTLMLRKGEGYWRSEDADSPTRGRLLSYRAGYAIAFAGFVALVSLLPPIGFFQVARTFELTLMVKHGQVSVARALEQREQRVAAQYAPIRIGEQRPQPADDGKARSRKANAARAATGGWIDRKTEFLARRLSRGKDALDVYDAFFFNTRRDGPNDTFSEQKQGGVDWLLTKLRPLYNQSCVESQELSKGASSDSLWRWGLDGRGGIHLEKNREGRDKELSVALTSSLPAIAAPTTFSKWLVLIIAVTFLVLVINGLVRFVGRRFFLLDVDLPDGIAGSGSYVLISDPARNGREWDRNRYYVSDLVSDLGSVKKWPAWTNRLKTSANGAGLSVVLENFDYCMDDAAANAEKLRALEYLVGSRRQVVLVSAVDPMTFSLQTGSGRGGGVSGNGDGGSRPSPPEGEGNPDRGATDIPPLPEARTRARWEAVLSSFPTLFDPQRSSEAFGKANPGFLRMLKTRRPWRYVEAIGKSILGNDAACGAKKRDRAREQEQISQLTEQARTLHQTIWRNCTEGQRCSLIQLAQDGMLSPKNKHLRPLIKRGLIVRDPDLRLMDESFRRFVISISHEQDIEAWRQQDGGSAWQLMKAPLLLILVGVAIFLFVTQKDVYDSTISFMSAITAGIAALFKLLGMFQKGRGGAGDIQ